MGVSVGPEVNVGVNVLDGTEVLVNVLEGSEVFVNVLVSVWLVVGVVVSVGRGVFVWVKGLDLGVSVLIAIIKSLVTIPNIGHQMHTLHMQNMPSKASKLPVSVFLLEAFIIPP